MRKLVEVDWPTFLVYVQSFDPPLLVTEYDISDTEHITQHQDKETGDVMAVQESPRTFRGNNDYANQVLRILEDAD